MGIVAFVFQAILILIFAMAGIGKVVGTKMHVESFERWRLPQWFRVFTGIVEIAGVALLVVGYWVPIYAVAGAIVFGIIAIVGIITHSRVKDSFKETSKILMLGILSFIVFFAYFID